MSIIATKPNPKDRFYAKCDCGSDLKADRGGLSESLKGVCPHCDSKVLFTLWYKHTVNRGAAHGAMVF